MIIYHGYKRASFYGIIERKINKNMKILYKSRILIGVLVIALMLPFLSVVAFAGTVPDVVAPAGSTLLPDKGVYTVLDCEKIMRYVNYTDVNTIKEKIAKKQDITVKGVSVTPLPAGQAGPPSPNTSYTQVLGCALTTGDVKMWMVPFFIRYMLEFIIGLAGLIAVGGIVYGGYLYLFAGLSDDKDKGKNAIKNGVLGFVLVLTSWAIVNIVISLVTL